MTVAYHDAGYAVSCPTAAALSVPLPPPFPSHCCPAILFIWTPTATLLPSLSKLPLPPCCPLCPTTTALFCITTTTFYHLHSHMPPCHIVCHCLIACHCPIVCHRCHLYVSLLPASLLATASTCHHHHPLQPKIGRAHV